MTQNTEGYFQKALRNFTMDAASLQAVRHLADLNMSVREIEERLDYPTPHELVQRTVWERLVENGTILLETPEETQEKEEVSYVREYGSFGRASFRRVTKKTTQSIDPQEYVPCDFGLLSEKQLFQRLKKAALTEEEQAYILGLPWEKKTVYLKKTERTRPILEKLAKAP